MDNADMSEAERASWEATGWLILLQEEPEDLDLQARFQSWLEVSAHHRAAWAKTEHAVDLIDAAGSDSAPKPAPEKLDLLRPEKSRQSGAPVRSARRWALPGVGVAIAASFLIAFAPTILLSLEADYRTATGEVRTVELADGTQITLSPESAVDVRLDAGARHVRLLSGEAFFQVARDPSRPFYVDIRTVETAVLGTAFSVRRGDESARVALAEGRLSVSHAAKTASVPDVLEPGDVIDMRWDGSIKRAMRPPDDMALWRSGWLLAQDETIGSVVDRLRPYHRGVIILNDRLLAQRSVTGVYNLADPIAALKAVAEAHGAEVRQITPFLVLVSRA